MPKKIAVDTSTPMSCLKSMGLLGVEPGGDRQGDAAHIIIESNASDIASSVWFRVGGVRLAHLTETVIVHDNGDVEGPCDYECLRNGSPTFCKTRYAKTGSDVMTMISASAFSKVADVCVYDPKRTATEETLYSVAGAIGSWIRVLLGDGWGIRIEVYCDKYSPSEIPEFKMAWMMLMIIIKAYMPHVRMMDTQASLRVECMSSHTSMRDLMSEVVRNMARMRSGAPAVATPP
jgi:hypothetical protein